MKAPEPPAPLFTQPVNKKEPCLLPTSADQQARSNFKAYWDGQCKNGYAYGLGRDIAMSDTHHMEEITVHEGPEDRITPGVLYDFVNNVVHYRVPEGAFPKSVSFSEFVVNEPNRFDLRYRAMATDQSGGMLAIDYSPFSPVRMFLNGSGGVLYRVTDWTAAPVVDPSRLTLYLEVVDPANGTAGGLLIGQDGTGKVGHVLINGGARELVSAPAQYATQLTDKYRAVAEAHATLPARLERAKQLEREYLYMACNGKHVVDGLDKEKSTQICGWRDRFKVAYDSELAKFTQAMERRKQEAVAAAQQRTAQEQLALERTRAQQLAIQQQTQALANSLAQFGQQMPNWNAPVVQNAPVSFKPFSPLAPQGGNVVNCVTAGIVISCR